MPQKTRKHRKRRASGNAAACSPKTKRLRTHQGQADRKKAAAENQTYLKTMLTSVLSQNSVVNYSQSGHEFVDVAVRNSVSEMEQSFTNPLGIPGTSSAFGMVLIPTQNSAKDEEQEQEHDIQSQTLGKSDVREEVSAGQELEIPLEPLPKGNEEQLYNTSADVADHVASGTQSTCKQASVSNTGNHAGSDSETEIELSDAHNTLLLKRCSKQSETLRKYKKKIDAKNMEIAQLKDLVVHAVAEAKAAKEDPNAKQTFTPDENLNITTAEIEHINSLSKNVGVFAQNLAIHFYGADELCKRSVTGLNYKGTISGYTPKPAISPTKLNFIYSATKERIALQMGNRNHEQISSLASKTLIHRALAEKIANLNKARKTAALRNVLAESNGQ